MKRLIDSFIEYITTTPAFQDAILAWRVPSYPFSTRGLGYWSEEQWLSLTQEVADSIMCRASEPDLLYDYVAPILNRLFEVTKEIMPEPAEFWTKPTHYECSSNGGWAMTSESEAEQVIWRMRNELHRLGAIIQSALIETHQKKDLFYYQAETFTCLLSGIRTYDIAAARGWGYLNTLNRLRGIRFQPISLLYMPLQQNPIDELRRNICVQANSCDAEAINSFFRSVVEFYKSGSSFDKAALLDKCDCLREQCEEIAAIDKGLMEKTIFVTSLLGTLSLCCPFSPGRAGRPQGVQEVYDRYLEVVSDVFRNYDLNCNEPICFDDLCKELGIKAVFKEEMREPINEHVKAGKTLPILDIEKLFMEEPYKTAKDYFEVLQQEGILDENYKRKEGFSLYYLGWAARFMVKNINNLHYYHIERIVGKNYLKNYAPSSKESVRERIRYIFTHSPKHLKAELPEDKIKITK